MNYLFTPSPGQAFKYYTALLILVALLIIGSFVFKNIYKKKLENRDFVFKKMYKKTYSKIEVRQGSPSAQNGYQN